MDRQALQNVVERACSERGCSLVELSLDDDNVIELTLDRPGTGADLGDCEYVHRAVLAAFDRDVEDYALTVSSLGIDAAQADEELQTIND